MLRSDLVSFCIRIVSYSYRFAPVSFRTHIASRPYRLVPLPFRTYFRTRTVPVTFRTCFRTLITSTVTCTRCLWLVAHVVYGQ